MHMCVCMCMCLHMSAYVHIRLCTQRERTDPTANLFPTPIKGAMNEVMAANVRPILETQVPSLRSHRALTAPSPRPHCALTAPSDTHRERAQTHTRERTQTCAESARRHTPRARTDTRRERTQTHTESIRRHTPRAPGTCRECDGCIGGRRVRHSTSRRPHQHRRPRVHDCQDTTCANEGVPATITNRRYFGGRYRLWHLPCDQGGWLR